MVNVQQLMSPPTLASISLGTFKMTVVLYIQCEDVQFIQSQA